jgi:predicted nucleic acid-binding Zn ribbon protein
MARIALTTHRKFLHLARSLALLLPDVRVGSRVIAHGVLETLWAPCWSARDPYVGTSDDIEAVCEWHGERGALTKALLAAGGAKSVGFIEPYEGELRDASEPHYQVHDFFDHCPNYVRRPRSREEEPHEPKWCVVCGDEFFSASPKSKTCSDRCRQAAHRDTPLSRSVTVPSQLSQSVTVPPKPSQAKPSVAKPSEEKERLRRDADALDASSPAETTKPSDGLLAGNGGVRAPDAVLEPETGLLVFPVDGAKAKGKHARRTSWALTEAMVAEWAQTYQTLDILDESRRALAWVKANPGHRKTYDGMPAFLNNWFARSVNMRARAPTLVTGSLKTAGNKAALEEVLRRRGHVMD